MTTATTRFPVEQARNWPQSEDDLPACSYAQACAMADIHEAKSYCRIGKAWLPPDGDTLSPAARRHFKHSNRTILSLIRAGWLQVAQELHGHPVKVVPTFA